VADVEYLELGDFLIIASEVLGIDPMILARASNMNSADSALHAPAAEFAGVEFYPDFVTKVGGARVPTCPESSAARRQQTDRLLGDD
jgi:hypothetical protein